MRRVGWNLPSVSPTLAVSAICRIGNAREPCIIVFTNTTQAGLVPVELDSSLLFHHHPFDPRSYNLTMFDSPTGRRIRFAITPDTGS